MCYKAKIVLLLPTASLFETWQVLKEQTNIRGRIIYDMVDNLRKLSETLFYIKKRTRPLTPMTIDIEFIPQLPDDLIQEDSNLGFYNSIILATAKRLNAFLITTEKRHHFLKHALRNIKIVNPCSWALAGYYYTEIAPKYIKTQEPSEIML